MNHKWIKLLSLLLCLLLPLTACQKGETQEAAKGRYLEEEYRLPAGLSDAPYVQLLDQDENGIVWLLATNNVFGEAPYQLWSSADGGQSWEQETPAWLDELNKEGYAFAFVSLAPGGGFYLQYYTEALQRYTDTMLEEESAALGEDEEGEEETRFEVFPGEGEDDPDMLIMDETMDWPMAFIRVDDSGIHPMPFEIPSDPAYGSGPVGITETADGDFVVNHYFNLALVDGGNGEIYEIIDSEMWGGVGNYAVLGDKLAVSQRDRIDLFYLATGDMAGDPISTSSSYSATLVSSSSDYESNRAITVDKENNAIYYADAQGIFRIFADGAVSERLVEGALTSLAMPSVNVRNIFLNQDGSITVHCYGETEGHYLLRYRYDPDAPTVPQSELKVYSLEDNQTVRQAMGMFQRENPNVQVTYTVGLTGEDGITAADALRTLSTQLLSGNGPDVLILDGMPMDSYMEKKVLLDLATLVEEGILSGDLLENVAGSLAQEGKVYGIPARFAVPMLLVDSDAAGEIRDLHSYTQWLAKRENALLDNTVPEALLRFWFPVYAPRLVSGNGIQDMADFSSFLEDIKAISGIEGDMNDQYLLLKDGDADQTGIGLQFGPLYWMSGQYEAIAGNLRQLSNAAPVHAAIQKKGTGTLVPINSGDGGVFLPRTILGINAAGKDTGLAVEFVTFMLTADVQAYSFDDGLPVNIQALQRNTVSPYAADDENAASYYSVTSSGKDGEVGFSAELRIPWVPESYLYDLIDQFSRLETASAVNTVILQMLVDETKGYFDGTATLEEAINAFNEKLTLYLAE